MPEKRKQDQHIQLVSPVMDHIPGFVMDNSACLDCGKLPLRVPDGDKDKAQKVLNALAKRNHSWVADGFIEICRCEKANRPPLVRQNQYKGKTVCICGSGPTLKKSARKIRRGEYDHVWGCNDALMWLTQNGYPCTHGVGIDQTEALREECWVPPPDVPYILATSVDSKLTKHLRDHGRNDITFFHSFIGFELEQTLYGMLYDETALSGEGLNVVNRAIGAAAYMGYDTIYVAGADCAFGGSNDQKTFHVQGDKVEGLVLSGPVDGKMWHTKPDMLMSAKSLVKTKREMGSRLQLLGNTLPVALQHKSDEFLDRCIRFATPDETTKRQARVEIAKYAPQLGRDDIKKLLKFSGTTLAPKMATEFKVSNAA